MLSGELAVPARPVHLAAPEAWQSVVLPQKQEDSSPAMSTTEGSRGSSVVASNSEFPDDPTQQSERLQGDVLAARSGSGIRCDGNHAAADAANIAGINDPIEEAATMPPHRTDAVANLQKESADVLAQLEELSHGGQLPAYAFHRAASRQGVEVEAESKEVVALEALDDYLDSNEAAGCTERSTTASPKDVGMIGGRYTSASLSTGSGVVTREELDRWVNQVNGQLHAVMDTMATKLTQCRARMADKDEVIKRLHWRLMQSEWSSTGGGVSVQTTQARTPQRRGARISSVNGPQSSTRTDAPASPASATRGVREGASLASNASLGLTASRGAAPASSTSSTGRALSPSPTTAQGRPSKITRDTRENARENREHTQLAYLRQEVAQLRRRNTDLSGQVRSREAQLDNLTGMMKEMQVANQRHLGLGKQRLQLREDTLQAMQEELLLSRGAVTPSGVGMNSSASAIESDTLGNRTPATPAGTGGVRRPAAASSVDMGGATTPGPRSSIPFTQQQTTQASRQSRRATEVGAASERGSSAARSLSAFARHKDRLAARRPGDRAEEQHRHQVARSAGGVSQALQNGLASPTAASGNPGSSLMVSPRMRPQGKVMAMPVGSTTASGTVAGMAQAAHTAIGQHGAAGAYIPQGSASAEAPPAGGLRASGPKGGSLRGALVWSPGPGSTGGGFSSSANRASSADARNRGTRGMATRRSNRRQ